jgi:ribosome maturation factor RimP
MNLDDLEQEISALAKELFAGQGFVLVDFFMRKNSSGFSLNLLADRPQGGITLDECSSLNRLLRQALEERNALPEEYALEVSSPGLDRPLKSKEDFLRFSDKEVTVFLNQPVNGRLELRGLVKGANETSVFINGTEIELTKINKAKPVI